MKKSIIAVALLSMLGAWGCCKKPAPAVPAPAPAQVEEPAPAPAPVVKEVAPAPTARELYEERYAALPTSHTVSKGECLWWISEYIQVYNDPFMWPLIYKANRDQIKNPDLIYPGQEFQIPRQFSLAEVKEDRRSAGAPKPYLPPQDAQLPADIRADLGWGF
jgi:LysM repeat protein